MNAFNGMAPTDCLYTYNMMPSEYGMELRKGHTEWASGVGTSVNTIIGFEGQKSTGSSDRLWAVAPDGIYDVSLYNTTAPTRHVPDLVDPAPSPAWTNVGGQAGYGVFCETSNDADNRFLFYADAENGLFMYSEEDELWTVPDITEQSGDFDVTKVAFVTTWKNRLWFVMQDSGDGWYLPPNAIAGTDTIQKFVFGSKFPHGGDLNSLWGWTIDGGAGMDDFLIATSKGGDILVYQGIDPAGADFASVGSFFMGELPESRRIGMNYGGELYILSAFGIISIRDLLSGVGDAEIEKVGPSAKIARFLRRDIAAGRANPQWAIVSNPADGLLQVLTPFTDGAAAIQYTQNITTRAWGMWRGVPANCTGTWNDKYYIGDQNGSVWLYEGFLDGVTLAAGGGQPIDFELLTSFQPPAGDPSNHKRVGVIRTVGIVSANTNYALKPVYDYDIGVQLQLPPFGGSADGSVWGTDRWGEAIWGSSASGSRNITGGSGMGLMVAIAMRGSADSQVTLVSWDVTFTQGGFL
jgi:hypothetical protein